MERRRATENPSGNGKSDVGPSPYALSGRPTGTIPNTLYPQAKATRHRDRSWLISILCALAVLGVLYVAGQARLPLPLVVLALLAACLVACGWAVLVGVRTRKKVDRALQELVQKGAVPR